MGRRGRDSWTDEGGTHSSHVVFYSQTVRQILPLLQRNRQKRKLCLLCFSLLSQSIGKEKREVIETEEKKGCCIGKALNNARGRIMNNNNECKWMIMATN